MTDADEIADLRREVARLRERIAELEAARSVLIFVNESLDRQRLHDARRLATRGLD
jgi:hypothetical protein